MIIFWIAAALLSAGAGAAVLFGAKGGALSAAGPDPSLTAHRRQLAEIDDLTERGLLAEDERRAARAEAGRRLLEAADAAQAPEAKGDGRRIALAVAAGAPVLAAVLYAAVAGRPGMADQPFLARVADWQARPESLDPPQMAAVLTAIAAKNPASAEARKRLGMAQLMAGNPAAAESALRAAVRLDDKDPETWVLLGEAFAQEAGQIGTDADFALKRAALLVAGLPADDPGRVRIEAGIAGVRQSAAQAPQAQTQGVTPEMIRGMVASLAARLEANPDDPEGWVRLVRAYTVLGETARRDAALAQASKRFAGRPDVLAALKAATESPQEAPR